MLTFWELRKAVLIFALRKSGFQNEIFLWIWGYAFSCTDRWSLVCHQKLCNMNPNRRSCLVENNTKELCNEKNILKSSNIRVYDDSLDVSGKYPWPEDHVTFTYRNTEGDVKFQASSQFRLSENNHWSDEEQSGVDETINMLAFELYR